MGNIISKEHRIYIVFFIVIKRFSGISYKDSARRAKCQIYLSISEPLPIFCLQSKLKMQQLTHERARTKLAWVLVASEKEEREAKPRGE